MFTIRKVSNNELEKKPSGIRRAFLESIYWKLQLEPNVWFAVVENVKEYETIRSNLDSSFAKKYKVKIKTRQTDSEAKLGTIYVMYTG